MRKENASRREYWFLVAAGTGLMLLTGAGAFWLKANADRSRLTLEMAVNEEPTAPIHGFARNNAVGDLLRSLPPDLAIEVCANLSDGAERPAPQPCAELRAIAAIAPAASSMIAAAVQERPSMTAISQLPAEVAASYTMAALPQPLPIKAPIAGIGAESSMVVPEAPVPMSNEPAAVGAQIASAQTTETDFDSTARDARIEVAPLTQATQGDTPAASIVDDTAMAPWLLSTDDPRQNANETGGLGAKPRSEQAALDPAEAAAAAKAQAQARARAAAAKAKAAAEAKAKAAARAKARENALASLRGSRDDSGGGSAKGDGNGKGGSSGEGGRD